LVLTVLLLSNTCVSDVVLKAAASTLSRRLKPSKASIPCHTSYMYSWNKMLDTVAGRLRLNC